MSVRETVIEVPAPVAKPAPRGRDAGLERHARTSLFSFTALMAQLGVILGVFYLYDVEDPAFMLLSLVLVAGFAIHYWLPFAWKEPFWLAWSVGGAFVMLDPQTAVLVLAAGGVVYGIAAAPLAFRWRLLAVALLAAVLIYGRATVSFGIPSQFWPVFGAIFMFRTIIYLYDLSHAKGRPSFREFVRYFFLLPNYYFLLFPVVDFKTLRISYFRRDIHEVAQQGIKWIARGAIQLLLYRLVYHWKGPSNAPDEVTTLGQLAATMVLTYMLYLRVSGQFHIIIGFLHLFGYDLPETHRKYLLAHSLTDFWRRINIYWKDFMVKVVYFPIYFRLRKGGEVRAQVVATILVFVATWFLHGYQWFWLRGDFLLTWPDTLFWGILGGLVTINLLLDRKRPPRDARGPGGWAIQAVKVAATFSLITVLWSLWNAPSLGEWVDLVTYWRVG